MLPCESKNDFLGNLAATQRQDLLEFIAMSSRQTTDAAEVQDLISASLTLKYLSVQRN